MSAILNSKKIVEWTTVVETIGSDSLLNIKTVAVDSRNVRPGSIFICLDGERVDGHNYIKPALEGGAVGFLVRKSWAENNKEQLINWGQEFNVAFFVVNDPLISFQQLAKAYIAQFAELTVIAVTGSNGKTTTKEILGSILSRSFLAFFNRGNLNSDIGLPMSVFEVEAKHQVALFEMGMNRKGEIAELVDIVNPKYGLITNVGDAHIGLLGSREAIAIEKRSIFSKMDNSCFAFIDENSEMKNMLMDGLKANIRFFGEKSSKFFNGVVEDNGFAQILKIGNRDVEFKLPGKYNLLNCLAAISIAEELNISAEKIAEGIEAVKAPFGRGEVLTGNVKLIRDCYNANPQSMRESINLFNSLKYKGRKILILGDMGELGSSTLEEHEIVLKYVDELGFDKVFILGDNFISAKRGIDFVNDVSVYNTNKYDEFEADVLSFKNGGDLVLMKGSRAIELERLTEGLLE